MRNQNLELRAQPPEVIPEKAGPEPRMVRFKNMLTMLRLRVQLRMRLRTDEQQKGKTVVNTWKMDDVALELPGVRELSLLRSRPGWKCSE